MNLSPVRHLVLPLCTVVLACTTMLSAHAASTTFINPVGPSGVSSADPHVMRHTDGYYYYVHTIAGQNSLQIAKSQTLSGIGAGARVTVMTPPSYCAGIDCYNKLVWAPEIYHFDGVWYLYFSASGNTSNKNHIWVITNTNADPTVGSWSAPTKINDTYEDWKIDQTVAKIDGQLYMAWSETAGTSQQYIAIAKMSDPKTIVLGTRGVKVFLPDLAWETAGSPVNEGPQFIVHGNKVHLTFSASYCGTDEYKLGEWTAPLGSDLTVASNWTKNPTPFLQKGTGAYGTGHHSFVKSPDGTEDWVVYHANPASGQGCGEQRTTRIQKVSWSGDTIVVGAPSVPGTSVVRPSGEGTGTILYRLRNQASGKVMSINRYAAKANGAEIWSWTNFNNTDQLWSLDPIGSGAFQFTSNFNGNVADVYNFSTTAGALVKPYPAIGTTNQQWKLIPTNSQYFKVQGVGSGLMLDVVNGSSTDGALIQQWTNTEGTPQRWLFERVN